MGASDEAVLRFDQIEKVYRSGWRRRVTALRGVTLSVAPGEVVALLGHNGAGKTTLMKLALGLLRPTRGGGTAFGRPLGDREARRQIGFQPEQPYLYPFLTARETLRLLGQLSGLRGAVLRRRVEETAARVALGEALDTQVRRLSRGWLQRLALAGALVAEPRLVLLDEPLGGLDPEARWAIKGMIRDLRAEGRTVWINSHVLPEIEPLVDRVAVMRAGSLIASGRLDQLLGGESAGHELELDAHGAESLERVPGVTRLWARPEQGRSRWLLPALEEAERRELWRALLAEGVAVRAFEPRRESLEQFYARLMSCEATAERAGRPPEEAGGAPLGAGRAREAA